MLAQLRLERGRLLQEVAGENLLNGRIEADVARLLVVLPEHARRQLGVEGAQRRLHAAANAATLPRIGLLNGRVIDGQACRILTRSPREEEVRAGAIQQPHDLAVVQGRLHGVLQAKVPELVAVEIS